MTMNELFVLQNVCGLTKTKDTDLQVDGADMHILDANIEAKIRLLLYHLT